MNTIFYSIALILISVLSTPSYSNYPTHAQDEEWDEGYPAHAPDIDFIKKVRFPTNQLHEGKFDEKSLPRFLAAAYNQKAIASQDFADVRCIKAKNLLTKGGFNTAQLLKVTAGCGASPKEYIVKEATDSMGEAINLEAVKNHPGIKEISAPNSKPGFPVLALPIAILSVAGHDFAPIVTLAPLAKGEEFCNFIKKHKNLATKADEAAVQKAYFELGRELFNFGRDYKMVHRDMKCLNVFYDGNVFTLIDLETMPMSFEQPDRCDAEGEDGVCKVRTSDQSQDYRKILFGNFARNEAKEVREMLDGVDLSRWFNASFSNFLRGQIEDAPAGKRHEVITELRRIFSADFAGFSMEYDKEKLDEVRSKYLIPILDKVNATLPK